MFKVVTYWLAELMNDKKIFVTLSHEHQVLKWLPLKGTYDFSGFKDMNEAPHLKSFKKSNHYNLLGDYVN